MSALTLEGARLAQQHRALRIAIPGLSAYYVLIAAAHALVLEGQLRTILLLLAAATALFAGLLIPVRDHERTRAHAHELSGVLALLTLANAAVHLLLTGDAFQTTNLLLIVVGATGLFTRPFWFRLTVGLTGLSFAAAVTLHPGDPLWPHFGFALLGAAVIGGLVFAVRVRGLVARIEAEQERDRKERERLAHESRYRAVVDLSPGAILVHTHGTVRFANRAAATLIGVENPDQIVGSPLFDLFPREDQDRLTTWSESALAQTGRAAPEEARLRALTGSWPYVELTTAPILWEGEPAAILVATDVTARHETERRRDELVALVGEELRSPVSIALQSLDGTPGPGRLERARWHLDHVHSVLGDLLDLELAQADGLSLQLASTNLAALVRDTVAELQTDAEHAEVTLLARVDLELVAVTADAHRLTQVLRNIIQNALRVSSAGQAVTVRLTVDHATATVEVEDAAPPDAHAPKGRIFERFGREPTETGAHGPGLTLALSKALIDSHGGEIGVRPSPASGTTFWFTLPCEPA